MAKYQSFSRTDYMIIKSTGIGRKTMPTRSLVNLKINCCYAMLMNDSQFPIKIQRGSTMAHLDETSFFRRKPIITEDAQTADSCSTATDKPKLMMTRQRHGDQSPHNKQHVPRCQDNHLRQHVDCTEPNTERQFSSITRRQLKEHNLETYPFLQKSDPKLDKNPYEILHQEIDTNNSLPTHKRAELMEMLERHKQCFSSPSFILTIL